MRIDRSDLADGPGDAHTDRHAQSGPDDPEAAGKAVSGDVPPDSSPSRPDPAARTELNAAYRAIVDAVYRQYPIDHSYAGVEKLERETVTPPMRRIEAEDLVGPEDRLKGKDRLAGFANLTSAIQR